MSPSPSTIDRRSSRVTRRAFGLLALAALAAWPAAAGTIDVNPGAAYMSGFGAEIDLVDNCIWPGQVTVDAPATLEGLLAACEELVVEGVRLVGPSELRAGDSVELGEGFSAAPAAAVAIVQGALLTRFAFFTDESPDAETTYSAEYRLNVDGVTLAGSDSFTSLAGLSEDGKTHFEVVISRHAAMAENRLRARAREDDGGVVEGQELLLPAGYNLVAVKWVAGAGNGSVLVSVNGSAFLGPTLLDNDRARIDRVRWGAVAGELAASSGSLEQDDFSSGF